jgi:hypothetical protein
VKRDLEIQKAFEVADDSLQAIQAYHLYTIAAQKSSDKEKIAGYFPDGGIRITPLWGRYYDKHKLVDFFSSDIFERIQARVSLIYVTSVFDDLLSRFIKHLTEKGFPQNRNANANYRKRIMWAYTESKRCPLCAVGNDETLKRLPTTFGIIDDARRLRNLMVHNHGLFDAEYESSAIKSDGIKIQLHPNYSEFKKNPQRPIPAIIVTNDLLKFVWSHVEALHVLHNSIQEKFFHVTEGYSYQAERKPLELKRMLFGNSEVQI